jgi:hypothetical protein
MYSLGAYCNQDTSTQRCISIIFFRVRAHMYVCVSAHASCLRLGYGYTHTDTHAQHTHTHVYGWIICCEETSAIRLVYFICIYNADVSIQTHTRTHAHTHTHTTCVDTSFMAKVYKPDFTHLETHVRKHLNRKVFSREYLNMHVYTSRSHTFIFTVGDVLALYACRDSVLP